MQSRSLLKSGSLTISLACHLLKKKRKILGIKKGHIGIVEKAQETSSDSDMHNTVLVPLLYFMNSGCVLECRETPTSWVTI